MIEWTAVQKQRLQEISATDEQVNLKFASFAERNSCYQQIEHEWVSRGKEALLDYQKKAGRPAVCEMEGRLVDALTGAGFAQVATPILLSKGLLAKMTITEEHPLFEQVFWVNSRKCLRPMLAPNLYYLNKDLLRIWDKPVSIFEVGPCFRKDTQGGDHMQEFTMLNLVEMGLPESERTGRLKSLAQLIMDAAGIDQYALETEKSEVYGETLDVVVGDLELGSGAMGPHPLDRQWDITVPWVGIGFGLERLVMIREGIRNVQKVGRSLAYLNGIRLNI